MSEKASKESQSGLASPLSAKVGVGGVTHPGAAKKISKHIQ